MSSEKSIAIVRDNNGGDSSGLPAAAAALSPKDRAGLLNALKDKLQNLARKRTDVMKTLTPNAQKRVQVLKNMQVEHDELEAKFLEEKAALEAKYEKLYKPLFAKRYDIVNGVVEVEQEQDEVETAQEANKDEEEKGVPNFWLTAMKSNEIIANEITERDERALKYLKDIRCIRLDKPRNFKLEFLFEPNPYFKNLVLAKTYHLIDDDGDVLEKVTGTEIEWCPGKCLTQKVVKKKPRKGSRSASKPVTKAENCESFFNFFKPPEISDMDREDDYDDIEFDMAEELENLMDQDFDIAVTIREKLIPHAVSWFTGEALEDDDDEEEEEEEEEEDN